MGIAMWFDLYKWGMEWFFCRSLQQKAFAVQPTAPPPVSNQAEDNSKDRFWAYPIFG